jgi:hypothetical protein
VRRGSGRCAGRAFATRGSGDKRSVTGRGQDIGDRLVGVLGQRELRELAATNEGWRVVERGGGQVEEA